MRQNAQMNGDKRTAAFYRLIRLSKAYKTWGADPSTLGWYWGTLETINRNELIFNSFFLAVVG